VRQRISATLLARGRDASSPNAASSLGGMASSGGFETYGSDSGHTPSPVPAAWAGKGRRRSAVLAGGAALALSLVALTAFRAGERRPAIAAAGAAQSATPAGAPALEIATHDRKHADDSTSAHAAAVPLAPATGTGTPRAMEATSARASVRWTPPARPAPAKPAPPPSPKPSASHVEATPPPPPPPAPPPTREGPKRGNELDDRH
jgi:hypothetical protein